MQFLFYILCFIILYFDAKEYLIYDKFLILLLFTMGRPHFGSMMIFLGISCINFLFKIYERDIMGFGDIKLLFVLINKYSHVEYIHFLCTTFILAAAFSIVLLFLGRKKEEEIPLGSFMMMAVFFLAVKK